MSPLQLKIKMRTFEKSLIKRGTRVMDIDWRIAIVLLPVIAAASWAAFNIAPAAIRQIQSFLNREA